MEKKSKGWTISLTAVSAVVLFASSVVADFTAGASNSSLLWGTYRPNLYFGTRPRIPESVMTGLMWFDASQFQGFQRKSTLSIDFIRGKKRQSLTAYCF